MAQYRKTQCIHCALCSGLQRGPGVPAGVGAGVPPPPGQCLPRGELGRGLCLSRLHLPQAQVLGQECGGGAQRNNNNGTAQVSTSACLSLFPSVSVCVCYCVSVTVCLLLCPSVSVSVTLCVYYCVYVTVCVYYCLCLCVSVCYCVSVTVCLCLSVPVCLLLCPCVSVSVTLCVYYCLCLCLLLSQCLLLFLSLSVCLCLVGSKGHCSKRLPPSRFNEAYTWSNPFCCVHNIILGSLWIEQYGTVEIINHRYICSVRLLLGRPIGLPRYTVLPVLPVLRPTPIARCCTPATPSFFNFYFSNKKQIQ